MAVEHSINKKRAIIFALGKFIKKNCYRLPANMIKKEHVSFISIDGIPGMYRLNLRSTRLFHKTEHELQIKYQPPRQLRLPRGAT